MFVSLYISESLSMLMYSPSQIQVSNIDNILADKNFHQVWHDMDVRAYFPVTLCIVFFPCRLFYIRSIGLCVPPKKVFLFLNENLC